MVKECQSALVILVTSSLRDPCFTLVRATVIQAIPSLMPPSGFIIKVKKILECICVNCGRLKADIVSGRSFLDLFCTPPLQFSGGSLLYRRTPSPRRVCPSFHEASFCPGRGPCASERRHWTCSRTGPAPASGDGWTRGRAVKWGLNEECENMASYTTPARGWRVARHALPSSQHLCCLVPVSAIPVLDCADTSTFLCTPIRSCPVGPQFCGQDPPCA